MSQPIRAVLFDLVGTLLDERSDFEALDATMAEVVARFSLDLKAPELSGEFSLALMEIIRSEPDTDEPAHFVPFERAAKDVFAGVLEFHGVHATAPDVTWFWSTYLDVQRRTWRLHAETRAVLKELKEMDLHVGVVTDADQYLATEIMPHLRLHGLVDSFTSAQEAGVVKPHSGIFELAVKKAGVTVDDVVMVGDSYERDVVGAHNAGISRAILVDRHRARTVDAPTLPNLKRVPRLVRDFPARPSRSAASDDDVDADAA